MTVYDLERRRRENWALPGQERAGKIQLTIVLVVVAFLFLRIRALALPEVLQLLLFRRSPSSYCERETRLRISDREVPSKVEGSSSIDCTRTF